MSGLVPVVGRPEHTALAGSASETQPGGPVVVLGDAPLPEGADAAGSVRWLARPAGPDRDTGRVVATGGDGLWRRAPWPVADALFELPPAADPTVLVVAADAPRRDPVLQRLDALGVSASGAEQLTVQGIAGASVVVLRTEGPDSPLPGEAMAVLAARRLLVCDRCSPAFGLLDEIDWFPGADEDHLAALANAAMAYPDAFERPRALGAIAARRHRASVVYERLAADLALEPASS